MPTQYQVNSHLSVRHLNSYETDFVYDEIFNRNVYFQHGISLNHHNTVLDIGANIGLFSLFVQSKYPTTRLVAVEPAPTAFNCLKHNLSGFGHLHQSAISDTDGNASFVFYPGYSVISGLCTDSQRDAALIKNGTKSSQPHLSWEEINKTVDKRFEERTTLTVPTRSISSLIDEHQLEFIDLLKIDTERSELRALAGISQTDWPKIQQVVLESHSHQDQAKILKILKAHGLDCTVEKDPQLNQSQVSTIYAKRTRKH